MLMGRRLLWRRWRWLWLTIFHDCYDCLRKFLVAWQKLGLKLTRRVVLKATKCLLKLYYIEIALTKTPAMFHLRQGYGNAFAHFRDFTRAGRLCRPFSPFSKKACRNTACLPTQSPFKWSSVRSLWELGAGLPLLSLDSLVVGVLAPSDLVEIKYKLYIYRI